MAIWTKTVQDKLEQRYFDPKLAELKLLWVQIKLMNQFMVDCSWLMSKCLINYCHAEYFSVRLPPIYLYYPKGEKMDSQKQPYLQVFLKFSIIQIRPMNLFMVECSTRCQNISERAKDTLEIYAVINHMWSLMPTKIQTCTKVIHTKYYKHLVYVLQGSTY